MSDYIWHSFTDPGPRSGAKKFAFERVSFVDGVESHRETRLVWCYTRTAFEDLVKQWQKLGSRYSIVGAMSYSYSIKE